MERDLINAALHEVTLRSKQDGNLWTMMWTVNSFALAEQMTLDLMKEQDMDKHNEIIKITKDYE
jgi:hypothetical protein